MFAICEFWGNLSVTLKGPSMNYNKIKLINAESKYYYQPEGELFFVYGMLFIVFQFLQEIVPL